MSELLQQAVLLRETLITKHMVAGIEVEIFGDIKIKRVFLDRKLINPNNHLVLVLLVGNRLSQMLQVHKHFQCKI